MPPKFGKEEKTSLLKNYTNPYSLLSDKENSQQVKPHDGIELSSSRSKKNYGAAVEEDEYKLSDQLNTDIQRSLNNNHNPFALLTEKVTYTPGPNEITHIVPTHIVDLDTALTTYPLENLKRLIDNKNLPALRTILQLEVNAGGEGKPYFKAMPKKQFADLYQHFRQSHSKKYWTLLLHAWLGYGGEIFYIKWDRQAGIDVLPKIIPGINGSTSEIINDILVLPTAISNMTYNPKTEVDGYMESIMLDEKASISYLIMHSTFIALMFLQFSFGGSYVEVQGVEDELDSFGAFGKGMSIALLVYSGIIYYTIFNLADTVAGCNAWRNSRSFVKGCFTSEEYPLEERIADAFFALNEFVVVAERSARMAYGAWYAGTQIGKQVLTYILPSMVGSGSAVVAIGTRAMASRKMGDWEEAGFTKEEYLIARAQYQQNYTFKKNEWKLFLSLPTLLLEAPPVYFAYQTNSLLSDDPRLQPLIGAGMSTASLLLLHLLLRCSTKRKEIIRYLKDQLPVDLEGKYIPSSKAKIIATICNLVDQTKRTWSFGYIFTTIFPETFNSETRKGQENLYTLLCIAGSIAASPFSYQCEKVWDAITKMFPSLFAQNYVPSDKPGMFTRIGKYCGSRLFKTSNPESLPFYNQQALVRSSSMSEESKQNVHSDARNLNSHLLDDDSNNGFPNSASQISNASNNSQSSNNSDSSATSNGSNPSNSASEESKSDNLSSSNSKVSNASQNSNRLFLASDNSGNSSFSRSESNASIRRRNNLPRSASNISNASSKKMGFTNLS